MHEVIKVKLCHEAEWQISKAPKLRVGGIYISSVLVFCHFPFPEAFPLLLPPPFPNDLPSNPGRALLLFFTTPFRLSLFRSLRIAILSDRFFCFAAIEFVTCSFRSSLDGETQSVK